MWAQTTAEIGKIIRAARLHRGLSQADLARLLGTTQAWVSEVEKGKDTAQIGMVLRVLNRLGVKLKTDVVPWRTPKATGSAAKGVDLTRIIRNLSQPSPVSRKEK
jgi:y4mF family transcriptional regulator